MKIQYFIKNPKGTPYDYLGILRSFSRYNEKNNILKVNLVFVIRQK